ncbi:M23 family metallopeptidase [Cohnella faecalis]|uniref:M23 family peptidase n=1 Tax=Cohnella faecalis TaxID=2315694 RepID=A0A398CMP2_9BACL|nr:M23 family metallopeptidase [Cohnella faecalis]RIE02509.1 M23 family peptidase [Cohnella faecalis]
MKWHQRKFTFMVIPDANSSVIRFQVSSAAILAGIVLIAALGAAAVTSYLMYRGNSEQIGTLERKLSASANESDAVIAVKDDRIEELQSQLAGLSDQAKDVQSRMDALGKLESQLKEMAGIGGKDGSSAGNVPSANDEGDYSMDGGGTGGEELPVTEEAMDDLVDETSDFFAVLNEQLRLLKPQLEATQKAVQTHQKALAVTPTIWPTDSRRVTSLFGIRRDPFTHRAKYHAGIDIAADTGEPVYAAADGTVVIAEKDSTHGNYIMLDHGKGIKTRYLHLSLIGTKVGAKVKKGDLIGEVGSTGRSTGPHLHYEVNVNGSNIDPRPYLNADRRENG